MNIEERMKVAESPPPPTSFLSLPNDIVLNCLARISRIHHPTLSLVSKTFGSILGSSELVATRIQIGKTENHDLYVCLDLNQNPNPSWFMLSPIPKQQKLIPIPSFPYQHPKGSTVITKGSEIYVIGGKINENRSKKVFVLDCKSHQWRTLQEMHVTRGEPVADVIDGKIYVLGGWNSNSGEDFVPIEVYDPKTQTWEPLSPETLDLTFQKSLVPGELMIMGGQVYCSCGCLAKNRVCLVEIEKMLCQTCVKKGKLMWKDLKKNDVWSSIKGLEGLYSNSKLSNLDSVTNSTDGRRLIVWWKYGNVSNYTMEIWCAEISFKRRGLGKELWGFVGWSKNVFTFNGCSLESDFVWHSTIVTQ